MKHPGGPWGRPLSSLCAFPFCTSLRGPVRAVAIRLSGSCSQVIFCAINFSLCGQIEQRTNRKAIPQTNCAPRSVAAAAYATNVPPAHLLNAAAKETPFRGEDSVFLPSLDPPYLKRPRKGLRTPPWMLPGELQNARFYRRNDPRGRLKRNGLPRRFAPRNDVEKGTPCEAPNLVLHPGSAKRSGSARKQRRQTIQGLQPDWYHVRRSR